MGIGSYSWGAVAAYRKTSGSFPEKVAIVEQVVAWARAPRAEYPSACLDLPGQRCLLPLVTDIFMPIGTDQVTLNPLDRLWPHFNPGAPTRTTSKKAAPEVEGCREYLSGAERCFAWAGLVRAPRAGHVRGLPVASGRAAIATRSQVLTSRR